MNTTQSDTSRSHCISKHVGRRHWAVLQTVKDMAPDRVTFADIQSLTKMPTWKLATSLDFLCRHSYVDRVKGTEGGGKALYKFSGREAANIDALITRERPKPLAKLKGASGGVRRKYEYMLEKPKRKSAFPTRAPTNGTSVQATAFVRLRVNGEDVEMTYAEANRLWEELGRVFVVKSA